MNDEKIDKYLAKLGLEFNEYELEYFESELRSRFFSDRFYFWIEKWWVESILGEELNEDEWDELKERIGKCLSNNCLDTQIEEMVKDMWEAVKEDE